MDDFSSGGDSKTEDDVEKRLTREKEGKDHDRDREEGTILYLLPHFKYYTLINIHRIYSRISP